jgi:hypothetical protein
MSVVGRAVCRRALAAAVTATAGVLVLAACSALPGSGGGSDDARATVGQVDVAYPKGWTVLGDSQRPEGWDWAAQDVPGDTAGAQLAVDGDYSALDVGFSVANLMAAAQVGTLPEFAVSNQEPVKISGAGTATRVDFTYRADGADFRGVWVVARSAKPGTRTVVVQLTGRAPVDDALVSQVIDGMEVP